MFKVSFSQAVTLNSFFLLVSALLSLVQWFVWASYKVSFVLSFCLFFSSDGQGWVKWWSCLLMIGFVFLFCLYFKWGSWRGCYWWLGDAEFCIQVVSFVWVLTIWYSLGQFSGSLGSWSHCSLSKGSGLDLWSGTKIPQVVCYGIKGE